MSDDLLERATRALRAEGGGEPSPERAALIRARVLAPTKRRAQLRPQNMWQWAAVVCLGFFVSTAMAHVIRVQLPRVIEALREGPSSRSKPAPKRARPAKPLQPRAAVPEVTEPAAPSVPPAVPEPAAPSVATEPAPAPSPRAPVTPQKKGSRRPVAGAPSAEHAAVRVLPDDQPAPLPAAAAPAVMPKTPAAESAELALFRRAQSLHLAHDPHAIEAWDAYLRVAGSSALAPEARYNRALGLVRARRFAEAKRALAPFAQGAYGTYRRQDAEALLGGLPK